MIAASHQPPAELSAADPAQGFEASAWRGIRGVWRQVYGNFPRDGVSVEWHDFETPRELDWGSSFHHDSLEICLNLSGTGVIRQRRQSHTLENHTVGLYRRAAGELAAGRGAGERHQFVTVELSRSFLAPHLAGAMMQLQPLVRSFLQGNSRRGEIAAVQPMTTAQQTLSAMLHQPPVPVAAQPLWYHGKIMELIAQLFFLPEPELFCARQIRVARERVEKVKAILVRNLETPPNLDDLGRQVGCSSFYLSRIFSQETGTTISQHLRKIRMERAAELLLTGRYNVTEVALEIGYSSLSHFSRTFCETTGHCPALYAATRLAKGR